MAVRRSGCIEGGRGQRGYLVQETGRVKRENCIVSEGKPDKLPKGVLRHTLVCPKDTWE